MTAVALERTAFVSSCVCAWLMGWTAAEFAASLLFTHLLLRLDVSELRYRWRRWRVERRELVRQRAARRRLPRQERRRLARWYAWLELKVLDR